jgi:3-dehydroquinate synthase
MRAVADRYTSELAIGPGLLARLGASLREVGLRGKVFLVSDDRVFPLHGETALSGLRDAGFQAHVFLLKNGEPSKELASAGALWDWLARERAERIDAIVALGGGVVGDVAGFVAATYLRGIPLVQAPTTVLAQVDSSIGGKVAINHPVGKNLIGAFYPARLIVSDTRALVSLPRRELASGWAEAIKTAMILDAELLDVLDRHAAQLLDLPNADLELVGRIVERCARHKVRVVEEDERETGLRMILNYGHTIGHAMEAALHYETLLHGEAVSIGMAGAAAISVAMGRLDPAAADRQNAVLQRYGLPIRFPADAPAPSVDEVVDRMASDKKARSSRLNWILLDQIGHATIDASVPPELVRDVVGQLLGLTA